MSCLQPAGGFQEKACAGEYTKLAELTHIEHSMASRCASTRFSFFEGLQLSEVHQAILPQPAAQRHQRSLVQDDRFKSSLDHALLNEFSL